MLNKLLAKSPIQGIFLDFEIFNQGLLNPKVSLKLEILRCHTCLVCHRIAQ